MQCKVCSNEQMVQKKLDVPIWKDGKFVIVEDVMGYDVHPAVNASSTRKQLTGFWMF